MKPKSFHSKLIELNLSVIFISTSGVLGRYIDLPVPIIILFRALIAGVLLFAFCKIKGFSFKIERKDLWSVLIGGFLLGAHWITYFYALKLSTVAIGMLALFTFPAITAILEPIILKKKLLVIHLVLGALVSFGVNLLSPDINFENEYFIGICLGVLSAVCYSLRNIMLKPQVKHYNQSVLMFSQLAIISLFLLPLCGFMDVSQVIDYLPTTILLAMLTTAIGHTMFIYSLKHFSAASASLISSLQPIYGMIMAFIFLSETPSLNTLLGGSVIISTVLIESIRLKQSKNRE